MFDTALRHTDPVPEAPWPAVVAAIAEAPDLIRIADDDQVTIYASDASVDLLGFCPQELMGGDVTALDHPDDRAALLLTLAEARCSGRPARCIHRVQHRDGDFRWFETTVRVVPTDGAGSRTVLISRDATGWQELARSRGLTRERLGRLLEALSDPLVVVDTEGRIIAATSAWLALVAHPGRAVGAPVDAVCRWRFGADASRRLGHVLRRAIRTGSGEAVLVPATARWDGRISVVCTPLTTPVAGNVAEIVMVFRTDALPGPTADPVAVERFELLTPRERDVLLGLADGLGSQEVAALLGICESTVRGHTKSLLRKLQVHTQLQAVMAGIRAGIVPVGVGGS